MLENNINNNSCTTTTTDCCFVECTTTTTLPCINPIDQLFQIAREVSEVNGLTKIQGLIAVLDRGFFLNSCGMCCSDCTYIFASAKTYNDYIENKYSLILPSSESLPPLEASSSTGSGGECCINIYGQPIGLPGSITNNDFFNISCCNNFTECVESIFEYFVENNCEQEPDFGIFSLLQLYITILNIGVVEQGAINGETQVCKIFENMKDYFETTCFLEEYFTILDKGIIIDCIDGKMVIASFETYLKLIEP